MKLLKDIIIYALLGAIQGFSEPIPISSSGHLVLFQSIFEKPVKYLPKQKRKQKLPFFHLIALIPAQPCPVTSKYAMTASQSVPFWLQI